MADFLLVSRHDPLKIGLGEPGMEDSGDNDSTITTEPTDSVSDNTSPKKSPKRKRKARAEDEVDMSSMLRSVVETCNSLNGNNKPSLKPRHTPTKDWPLKDIYDLIEQHKLRLKFL
mmetsp:Transcript_9710/g.11374  ORF Transcript_9710/g.11374 Transcript_9710/m.11374 type:complete len:116 (-) Transcript_9710:132-479(-)